MNHKTYTLDDGSTLLVWKLDSTTNARIKPLFQECYNSTADSYTLRGLTINVTGQSLHLPTIIDDVLFCDLQGLYAAYPELDPNASDVTNITTHLMPLNSDAIYDLRGLRVVNPKKGLYIIHGKKFVVH